MEEDIEILKKIRKEKLNAWEEAKAIENILNELDRLQIENTCLKKEIDEAYNYVIGYENLKEENEELKEIQIYLVNERRELEKIAFESNENYIPKQVIRDKFKRIKETKIKIDKINARNYMIFGDTERATGWFINLDYIEKILLDVPGYEIGDE